MAPMTRRAALTTAAAATAAAAGLAGADPAAAARPGHHRGDHHHGPLSVASEPYGTTAGGAAVERWVFGDDVLRTSMITYGATITRIDTVDGDGGVGNVVLGLSTLEEYEADSPYFGATIGRYANRIAGGRFTLDGRTYQVPVNDPATDPVNALHGGPDGFDSRVWEAEAIEREHEVGVAFTLLSPDGDQGFPGALSVAVEYTVSDTADLSIRYRATTDAPTVVNLTNHVYLNLAGEDSGTVYDHRLRIRAERFTPIDATSIPLGPQREVAGTPFDFREPHAIGERIRVPDQQILNALGYDHNWVLDEADRAGTAVVEVVEPTTRRVLLAYTDQPGVQVYTGNFLTGSLVGPGGRTYRQGSALTLETQHFPDSPNRPDYPTTVLRPGEDFTSWTCFAFRTY